MLIGHTKLKVTKIGKTHKVHAPKFRGVFVLRSAKRRRHADWAHQAKNNKNQQNTKVYAPKFQGRVFSEVGEAPQACSLGTPS